MAVEIGITMHFVRAEDIDLGLIRHAVPPRFGFDLCLATRSSFG